MAMKLKRPSGAIWVMKMVEWYRKKQRAKMGRFVLMGDLLYVSEMILFNQAQLAWAICELYVALHEVEKSARSSRGPIGRR